MEELAKIRTPVSSELPLWHFRATDMNPLVVNYTLNVARTRLSEFNLRTIAGATANFFHPWHRGQLGNLF